MPKNPTLFIYDMPVEDALTLLKNNNTHQVNYFEVGANKQIVLNNLPAEQCRNVLEFGEFLKKLHSITEPSLIIWGNAQKINPDMLNVFMRLADPKMEGYVSSNQHEFALAIPKNELKFFPSNTLLKFDLKEVSKNYYDLEQTLSEAKVNKEKNINLGMGIVAGSLVGGLALGASFVASTMPSACLIAMGLYVKSELALYKANKNFNEYKSPTINI